MQNLIIYNIIWLENPQYKNLFGDQKIVSFLWLTASSDALMEEKPADITPSNKELVPSKITHNPS